MKLQNLQVDELALQAVLRVMKPRMAWIARSEILTQNLILEKKCPPLELAYDLTSESKLC